MNLSLACSGCTFTPESLLNRAQGGCAGYCDRKTFTAGLLLTTSQGAEPQALFSGAQAACDVCTPTTSKGDAGSGRLGSFLDIKQRLQNKFDEL